MIAFLLIGVLLSVEITRKKSLAPDTSEASESEIITVQDRPLITTTYYVWHDVDDYSDESCCNHPTYWIYPPPDPNIVDRESEEWWISELSDLELAGVDVIFLVGWETERTEDKKHRPGLDELSKLEEVILKYGFDIKIAPFLGLRDADDLDTLISAHSIKINAFYDAFDQRILATHNRKDFSDGGKLLVKFWGTNNYLKNHGDQMDNFLSGVRNKIISHTNNDPFLISMKEMGDLYPGSDFNNFTDAIYSWNSPIATTRESTVNGFTTSSVGAGNKEGKIRPWRCHDSESPGHNPGDPVNTHIRRDTNTAGQTGSEGYKIQSDINKINKDTNYIFIQDYNEINEGAGWGRGIYPTKENPLFGWCADEYVFGESTQIVRDRARAIDNKDYLPTDFYIKAVDEAITRNFGKVSFDKVILGHNINDKPNQYQIELLNTGSETWTNKFSLGWKIVDKKTQEIKSKGIFTKLIDKEIKFGDTIKLDFDISELIFPTPTSDYKINIDIVNETDLYFDDLGDTAFEQELAIFEKPSKPSSSPKPTATLQSSNLKPEDLDENGIVNVNDFKLFINDYKIGKKRIDFNQNGHYKKDIGDFSVFVETYKQENS